MKTKYVLCVFAFLSFFVVTAQSSAKEKMEQEKAIKSKRTVLQRFDKKIIPSQEERQRRMDEIQLKRESILMLIDTSSVIKDRHRAKLKQDVIDNPFSSRLKKFLDLYPREKAILIASRNEK